MEDSVHSLEDRITSLNSVVETMRHRETELHERYTVQDEALYGNLSDALDAMLNDPEVCAYL